MKKVAFAALVACSMFAFAQAPNPMGGPTPTQKPGSPAPAGSPAGSQTKPGQPAAGAPSAGSAGAQAGAGAGAGSGSAPCLKAGDKCVKADKSPGMCAASKVKQGAFDCM